MRTAIILRSMYPGNPVYTWTDGDGWVQKDGNFPVPTHMWLSNQTGIQIGSFGAVDITDLRSLFANLPTIYTDLVLDATEKCGLKDTRAITANRWERLSNPRPLEGEPATEEAICYATYGSRVFALHVTEKGKGGWYVVDGIPEAYKATSFEVWDYTFYAPKTSKKTYSASAARKMLTATLDCLYCFPDDDMYKAYLVWSQSKIKDLWERSVSASEGQGANEPDKLV